MFAEFELLNI